MGESNSKCSNWQIIHLKNIQAAPATQFQKNKQPNQKMGQRNKQTFLQRRLYRWLTNTWKDAQHHSLSEKCKSKPKWGTISLRSEWLLSKSLQTINAGEGAEKREPSYCWWECKLVQSLWRTVWRCLKKTGNRNPIWPSNPTAGHTHWGSQNWKRHVYPNVHHSTVYNSQDMEAT